LRASASLRFQWDLSRESSGDRPGKPLHGEEFPGFSGNLPARTLLAIDDDSAARYKLDW